MNIVLDAGVLALLFVKEIHTIHAEQLIDPRLHLHGPELIVAEFGNVLWKKCQFEEMDESSAITAIASLSSYQLKIHSNASVLEPAFIGAMQTRQSVYDWMYLALALSLKCKLVTADRRFFRAMRATKHKNDLVWIENVSGLT